MAKKMRGKRLGKDVRDLVFRVDIDELESLHFMQIAQVMILEEHVLAAFVIDRIAGLCNCARSAVTHFVLIFDLQKLGFWKSLGFLK